MTASVKREQTSGIDREQLALEIARETGVQLPPDDAILTLIAAHDIVLNSYEKRWLRAVKRIERCANAMGWIFLSAMLVGFAYVSFLAWVMS